MLSLRFFIPALAWVVFVGSSLYGQTQCDSLVDDSQGCNLCSHGDWWVSAEALFLDRSQNYEGVLVIDENTSGSPAMLGDALRFESVAGPRFALGKSWKSGAQTELVYFGLHDWVATARVDGDNNLSLPGDIALATQDFFAADSMVVTYGSRIHNVEANLWMPLAGVEGMLGFRYFSMTDDLNLQSFDTDTFQSNYLVNTDNHLYGGQVGLRRRWCKGALRFSPEAKFGVFVNANEQHSLLRDLNNTLPLRDVSFADNSASTVSELRLVGDLGLTRHLQVGFGYNFLWVTDLAQAPYQLDFTDTASSSQFVDNGHSIFLHGASVGLILTR
jgi:hypothetical protein